MLAPLEADGKRGSDKDPNDSCAGRTDAELDRFFKLGLAAFSRWGLPRPVGVRSGNFQVDENFYRAATRWGLGLSSSLVLRADRAADKGLVAMGVRHNIGKVLEFPVFSYTYHLGRRKRHRPLAITACSHREILSVLRQAYDYRVSPIVINTHPQEYVKRKDITYAILRRNRVNQARFMAVLRFLSENRDKFATLPISALRRADLVASPDRPPISVPAGEVIARMFENVINDRV